MRSAVLVIVVVLALIGSGCGRKKNRVQAPVSSRPVLPSTIGAYEEGIASWYGDPYHGRRTANGEVYDQEKMTAAHPTLRFGVIADVTNLSNGLRTRVRINDRGPFVKDRAIDLSRAAAREIAMLGPGTAPVRVVVVGVPGIGPPEAANGGASGGDIPANGVPKSAPLPKSTPLPTPTQPSVPASLPVDPPPPSSAPGSPAAEGFAIQMGAFANYENAAALRSRLLDRALDVRVVAGDDPGNRQGVLWRVLVGSHLSRSDAEKLFAALRVDFPRIILVADH
jgi:rare lipoprotein A